MKKLTIYIFSIGFIALLSNCNKNLQRIPLSQVSDASFWKTSDDYKLAANNFYFSLEAPNLNEIRSDIAYGTAPNSISNGTYIPDENSGFWDDSYSTIRGCNYLIEKARTSPIKNQIREWVAEARFFRAYTYFNLLKTYGGVPLVKGVLNVNSPELYGARAKRSEIAGFIFADLDSAAADLPEKSTLTGNNVGRISKGAALALKARAALFEGTWEKFHKGDIFSDPAANTEQYLQDAIDASQKVIESNQYSLYKGMGDQSYRYLFIDEGDDSPENILDHRYDMDVAPQPGAFGNLIMYGEMVPTKKLIDLYLCKDGLPITKSPEFKGYNTFTSEYENRDPRMLQTVLEPGKKVVKPFFPDINTAPENWPGFTSRPFAMTGYMLYKFLCENPEECSREVYGFDWHIIRYAEVLLIYAEAKYEKNGSISDDDLNKSINLIRDRAGMPALTNEFVNKNGLDMRTEIRRERTVELAFEGFRLSDLKRWKIAETEMPMPVEGFKYEGTAWQTKKPYSDMTFNLDNKGFIIVEDASKRSFDPEKNYLFPLPTKQVALNPQLKQNPGW